MIKILKTWWKSVENKEVMTFWSFANFQETFLDQSIWICKWVSWWCHRLTSFHSFCTQKLQNFIFQLWECQTCLNSSLNRWRIMLTPIYLDMRDILSQVWAKYWKFLNLCTKYMASSEVMTSSTHSFAYSYRLVKKCFVKICKTSKCHNFLIFQPIFIRFSLLCLKIFTLSLKFKLNLFRISPLRACFVFLLRLTSIDQERLNFALLVLIIDISLLWHNSFFVSLWTFQPTLVA